MTAMVWVRCDDGRRHLLLRMHRDRDGVTLKVRCGLVFGPGIGPNATVCARCAGLALVSDPGGAGA